MPIYSANRVGTVDLSESANDYNKCESFAEFLMNVQNNDMAIFEAIIVSDLKEIRAISEGATNEDIAAFNEESKKSFIEVIVGIFQAAKKKIGEIIDGIALKLAEFKARNYANIAEEFKNNVKEESYGKIIPKLTEKVVIFIGEENVKIPSASEFESTYNKYKDSNDAKGSIICMELLKNLDIVKDKKESIEKPADFMTVAMDSMKTERNIDANMIKYALGSLKDNKEIYNLKKAKKEAFAEIDSAAKKVKEVGADNTSTLNAVVTGYQQAAIAVTNLRVRLAQYDIRNNLKILKVVSKVAEAMSDEEKSPKTGNRAERTVTNDQAVLLNSTILAAELNDIDAMAEEAMYIGVVSCYSDKVIAEAAKIVAEAEAAVEADMCAAKA